MLIKMHTKSQCQIQKTSSLRCEVWFYARKAVRQQLTETHNSLMDRMAASYELFVKHTQVLDSSDRRKLMKKLKSVLDIYNPLIVLITNMMGHSYRCLMA